MQPKPRLTFAALYSLAIHNVIMSRALCACVLCKHTLLYIYMMCSSCMPRFRLAMYTVVQKTPPPLIHMTVFSTNDDRSIIFGLQCTELICKFCNITLLLIYSPHLRMLLHHVGKQVKFIMIHVPIKSTNVTHYSCTVSDNIQFVYTTSPSSSSITIGL